MARSGELHSPLRLRTLRAGRQRNLGDQGGAAVDDRHPRQGVPSLHGTPYAHMGFHRVAQLD